MERLHELIRGLPELVSRNILDFSGGSIGVRCDQGLYVSPEGAGIEFGWNLTQQDFVLFPGGGDASMASAGRRPHRLNRMHRTALTSLSGWNYTIEATLPGLLAFSIAGVELELSSHQSAPFKISRGLSLPLSDSLDGSSPDPEAQVISLLKTVFPRGDSGAVLISGVGLFAGANSLEHLVSMSMLLEKAAQARLWQLKG